MNPDAGFGGRLTSMLSSLQNSLKMYAMDVIASVNERRGGLFSSVAVETSTHCHRRCSYCPVAAAPKAVGFMRDEVFQKIVEQLASVGFRGRFAYHHYNEPLLNRNLERLVAIAKQHLPNARHVIYTSGDHLTSSRHDTLVAAGIDAFVVTDHGGRQLSLPVQRASGLLGPLRRTRVRLRKFGANTSLFTRGGLVDVANPRRLRFCVYPAYELVIGVQGDVILCCNDYLGEHTFGNVLEQSLVGIWFSAPMVGVRERLRRGQFDRPICQACAGIMSAAKSPARLARLSSAGGPTVIGRGNR
jgi:MoaA/NifB/PqqE/SkfB family radical SAM enzyme